MASCSATRRCAARSRRFCEIGLPAGRGSGTLPVSSGCSTETIMIKRFSLARLAAVAAFAVLSGLPPTHAQTPQVPIPGVEPALLDDIVAGSRILADLGVVDA